MEAPGSSKCSFLLLQQSSLLGGGFENVQGWELV